MLQHSTTCCNTAQHVVTQHNMLQTCSLRAEDTLQCAKQSRSRNPCTHERGHSAAVPECTAEHCRRVLEYQSTKSTKSTERCTVLEAHCGLDTVSVEGKLSCTTDLLDELRHEVRCKPNPCIATVVSHYYWRSKAVRLTSRLQGYSSVCIVPCVCAIERYGALCARRCLRWTTSRSRTIGSSLPRWMQTAEDRW